MTFELCVMSPVHPCATVHGAACVAKGPNAVPLASVALTTPVPLGPSVLPVGTVRVPGRIIAGSSERAGVVVPVATSI